MPEMTMFSAKIPAINIFPAESPDMTAFPVKSPDINIFPAESPDMTAFPTKSPDMTAFPTKSPARTTFPASPSKDTTPQPKMNLSFSGCGFLGIYHVGVSACFKKYAPELLVGRIAGASAGSLAGACLLCHADLGVITSSVLKTATEARAHVLGPFSPTFNIEKILKEGLLTVLPSNAHEIVSGRLFVSVTRISDGKNVILSQFDSREELVQALLCSSFIPGFSGYRPLTIKGVRYMDGGFSDNLPELDSATVTVSPFAGEADVCPKDNTAGLITISLANTSIEISRENLQRFARILFPPPPEILNKMCQQGFNDALEFLQRNNLMACTRCIAVQSTLPLNASSERGQLPDVGPQDRQHLAGVSGSGDGYGSGRTMGGLPFAEIEGEGGRRGSGFFPAEGGWLASTNGDFQEEFDEGLEDNCADCPDCRQQRYEALLDDLPDTVGAILQEAVDLANAEVTRWFSLSNTKKLLAILTMPVVYSFKLPYRLAKGVLSCLPSAPSLLGLHVFTAQLLELAKTVLLSRRRAAVTEPPQEGATIAHHHHHHKKREFSCNIAVTEFAGAPDRKDYNNKRYSLIPPYDSDDASIEDGYNSESEALNRLAADYAVRSSRSVSLIPSQSRAPSRSNSRANSRAPSRAPSRAVSRAVSRRGSVCEGWALEGAMLGGPTSPYEHPDPDLFLQAAAATEDDLHQIINVTSRQREAVMEYYYLDDDNQMQVTEIFDMSKATDDDSLGPDSPYHHSLQRDQQQQQQQQQQQLHRGGILRNPFSSLQLREQQYIHSQLSEFRDRLSSAASSCGSDDDAMVLDDELSSNSSRSHSEPEADQHLPG